jgi:hypothetical protein
VVEHLPDEVTLLAQSGELPFQPVAEIPRRLPQPLAGQVIDR